MVFQYNNLSCLKIQHSFEVITSRSSFNETDINTGLESKKKSRLFIFLCSDKKIVIDFRMIELRIHFTFLISIFVSFVLYSVQCFRNSAAREDAVFWRVSCKIDVGRTLRWEYLTKTHVLVALHFTGNAGCAGAGPAAVRPARGLGAHQQYLLYPHIPRLDVGDLPPSS